MENETTLGSIVRVVDRYEIVAVLGEGNYGIVYRAFDSRLHRTVAIKTIKPAYALDQDLFLALDERFTIESRASSMMGNHPNLVTVYDIAITPDTTRYLILEYVPGGTLATYIHEHGPLPVDDALRLTADISRGLFAAHQHNIIHRDIKPANVFIAADGRAQVGDFGVAQVIDLTDRGIKEHPGTRIYMSPEQEMSTNLLRPDSDQYTVGLVFFEMLTKKSYKLLRKREIEEYLTQWPRPVRALFERMTAPDPEDRYDSMLAVEAAIAAIRRHLFTGSDTAAVPVVPLPAQEYVRRGIAHYYDKDYERAIADYTRAIELDPTLASAYDSRGTAYYDRNEYERAIDDYTHAIRFDPTLARAYYNRGLVYHDRGEYERAVADYTRAIALDSRYARAYNNRGLAYANRDDYERAIPDYTRAIALDPHDAGAYNNRGSAYHVRGDFALAIADYTRAIELDPDDASAYYNRSFAYRALRYDVQADADEAEATRRGT